MPSVQALQHQVRRAGVPATIRLFHRRELLPLTAVVAADEHVLDAAMGTYQGRRSIVLVTDRRRHGRALHGDPVGELDGRILGRLAHAAPAGGEVLISQVCPRGYAQHIATHIAAHVPPA